MDNTRAALAWFILLAVATILIVAGFQGSLGKLLAVALTPSRLVVHLPN